MELKHRPGTSRPTHIIYKNDINNSLVGHATENRFDAIIKWDKFWVFSSI